jgi:tripeptide aminopeptidase
MGGNGLVSLFLDLVKVDSPTGKEERVANFICDRIKDVADTVKMDHGNVFAHIDGNGEPIFLSAHIDTVEPGVGIKPKTDGNLITSDGTTILAADDKAAVAAIINAAESLHKKGLQHRPIDILFTRSEESYNFGAVEFDYGLLQAKAGFCFDAAHPVGTIIKASPYYENFTLVIKGKAVHASTPDRGVNALLAFSEIMTRAKFGALDEESVANVGLLETGTAINTVPGELTAKGEFRSFDEGKLESHKQHLREIIEGVKAKYGFDYTLKFIRENPGYRLESEEELRLLESAKAAVVAIGLTPHVIETQEVSDANIFNEKGITCINLSDGVQNPHTKEERISISEMENLVRLILKLVEN